MDSVLKSTPGGLLCPALTGNPSLSAGTHHHHHLNDFWPPPICSPRWGKSEVFHACLFLKIDFDHVFFLYNLWRLPLRLTIEITSQPAFRPSVVQPSLSSLASSSLTPPHTLYPISTGLPLQSPVPALLPLPSLLPHKGNPVHLRDLSLLRLPPAQWGPSWQSCNFPSTILVPLFQQCHCPSLDLTLSEGRACVCFHSVCGRDGTGGKSQGPITEVRQALQQIELDKTR